MKLKAISILVIIFLALSSGFAQKNRSKKKKKSKKSAPKLTVVEIKQTPQMLNLRLPVPTPVQNGSLFSDDAQNVHMLIDFKARQIGDLVFVDVVETSTATVSSSATRSRDSGTAGGLTNLVGALPIPGAATTSGVIGALGKRTFDGKGSTERTSNVTARIAARVIEVLPNGDLRIQAVKKVKINKETEQLAVTGIVRKKDIASDNSIQTILIGDLRVEFNGKGVASKDNAPGWLFRLFDKINPF